MAKKIFEPGSQQWEDICIRCGLCCLVKYCDNLGNVWLTNIRCDMLDPDTKNCRCYSADVTLRDTGHDNCAKHNGSVLNMETLRNDYVVPSFCAYVQKYVEHDLLKKCSKRPDIDLTKTIPESAVKPEEIKEHVIPGSKKYFQYNQPVNQSLHKQAMEKVR